MLAWLVALIIAVSPPSPKQVAAGDLAQTVIAAIDKQGPLPGATKEQTAVVMLAVAYKESSWFRSIDELKVRGKLGECGLWQVMPVHGKCPPDRLATARIALERMKRSFETCRSHPLDERLAVYTAGSCTRGLEASRIRMHLAQRWYLRHPPTKR